MGGLEDPLRGRLMAGPGPLSPRASSEAPLPSPTSPGVGAPSVRPRSSVYTPYGVMTAPQAADLDAFGEACRLMFAGDASAARTVEQTMRTIPAGAKAR